VWPLLFRQVGREPDVYNWIALAAVPDHPVVDVLIAALKFLDILQAVDHPAEGRQVSIQPTRRFADDDVEFRRSGVRAIVAGEGKCAGTMDHPQPAFFYIPAGCKGVHVTDFRCEEVRIAKRRELQVRPGRPLEFRLQRWPPLQRRRLLGMVLR